MDTSFTRPMSCFQGKRLLPLLGVFLFLASFYSHNNLGDGAIFMPYTWAIWIAVLPIIAFGIFLLSRSETIVLPRYWPGLLALPLGLLVAGLVADLSRPVDWALRIGFVLGGFLFFFSLFQYKSDRSSVESLLLIMVVASLAHAVLALLQILGWAGLPGWLPHGNGLPVGIFQQVNLVASFSATGLVVSIYLLTVPGYKTQTVLYKLTLHVTVLVCAAIILATVSRAGLFGMTAGLALLLLARYRMFLRNRRRFALMVAALLAGLGYGFHLSDGMSMMESKLERGGYQESRVAVYQISWELFKEKPLFGHGLGSFQRVFQEKRINFLQEHPDAPGFGRQMFTHPHNEPLFWLVESGLVSVLGMLAAAIVSIAQLFKLGRERGLAYLGMIFPISLHVMVELPFYLSPIHWFAWLLLLYLIHSHGAVVYANRMSLFARSALPAVTVIAELLLIFFFVNTLQSLRDLRYFGASGDLAYLARVNENPVLHEAGAIFTLRTLLYTDVGTGGNANTRRFIEWAEGYVKDVPNPLIMSDLALAYSYAEDQGNARRVIQRAAAIYRGDNYLEECERQIEAGTYVEFFRHEKLRQ